MSQLTFADLVACRVPLSASEAAALTLAVARVMDARRAAGQSVRVPDDAWILLSSSGEVSIVEVHGSDEVDETAALSALLRRLLRLDERLPGSGQIVPGGLLIVLARNLGYIHLPATGPQSFRAALERFAAANPAVLAAVFWRAAPLRAARTAPGLRVDRAIDMPARADRRQRGGSRADLRRTIRELEQELFAARRGSSAASALNGVPLWMGRRAVAALLAACFVGAIAVASLAVPRGAVEEVASVASDIALQPIAPNRPAPGIRPASQRFENAPRSRDVATSGAPALSTARRQRSSKPQVTRTRDASTRRRSPDPLAVHRGGTRGIPFTLPSQ